MHRNSAGKLFLACIPVIATLCVSLPISGQFFVDCSGITPGAYTTINSVLPLISNGAVIEVVGTCTENVTLVSLNQIWMGAPWGQTMNLAGSLTANNLSNAYFYGMIVTNPASIGITISSSHGVVLDSVSSVYNGSYGLNVVNGSEVSVVDGGSYSNNGDRGIAVFENSVVQVSGWSAVVDVSNNVWSGVYAERSAFYAGGISIRNNKATPGTAIPGGGTQPATTGFGISFAGGARGILNGWGGTNTIEGNQAGGIDLSENSEISLAGTAGTSTTIVQGNGPLGIFVGDGSQLTLYDNAQITNHSYAGVEVYGNSQANIYGPNQISNNGTDFYAQERAGIVIDGNSQAYITGTTISQNGGPGIMVLVNSSVDISGATFAGNAAGPVLCDSSAWLASDFIAPAGNPEGRPEGLVGCRVPNSLQKRPHPAPAFTAPDVTRFKALEAQYQRLVSAIH